MGYEKYGLRGVRLYMQVDSENTSQKKKIRTLFITSTSTIISLKRTYNY